MAKTWERAVPVGDGKAMWTDSSSTRFRYRVVEVRAACRRDGFSAASQLVPSHVHPLQSEYGLGTVQFVCRFSVAVLKRKWKEVVPLLVSTLYPALLNADE